MDEVIAFILSFVFLFVGIFALVKGSDIFVGGAASLAKVIGVSEHMIGITLVAFATSLPEVFVCALAAFKGEGNIALGNVIGSNVANIGLVLGISVVVMGIAVKKEAKRDSIILCLITLLLMALMVFDRKLTISDGVLFLIIYAVFFAYLSINCLLL